MASVSLTFFLMTFINLYVSTGTVKVNSDAGQFIGYEYTPTLFSVNKGMQFLGIPYAEPPTGERRFKKPVMKAHLDVPFDAVTYGPSCPQLPLLIQNVNISEDCLTLNVFVPAYAINGSDLPVMVWIHGGGFWLGNADFADPTNLACFGDVVVVSMNYRLGIFGFLSTGDSASPGNYGLWDQHLAIRWVKNNIASFGGDTSKITIFGQSAGGASVDYQGMYPGNKGLFQRAIAESGAQSSPWAYGKVSQDTTKILSKEFGCNTESSEQVVECLKAKSIDDLVSISTRLMLSSNLTNPLFLMPTVDDDFINYSLVYENHLTQDTADRRSGVEYIMGINNHDGSILAPYGATDSTLEYVFKAVASRFTDNTFESVVRSIIRYAYTSYFNQSDSEKSLQLLNVLTDVYFTLPMVNSLAKFKKHSNKKAFMYLFKHTPHFSLTKRQFPGSDHADELNNVFGFSKISVLLSHQTVINETTIPEANFNFTRTVMTFWTNFAKTGNPNLPVTEYLPTEWPEYTLDEQKYLEFGETVEDIKQDDHLYADRVALFTELIPSLKFPKPKDCSTSNAAKLFTSSFNFVTCALAFCLYWT